MSTATGFSQRRRAARLLAQLRRPAAPPDADSPPGFLSLAASALTVTPPELRARKVQALRLLDVGTVGLVEGQCPLLEECPPGSVLVRARFASICGSDLEYFNSRVPMGRRTPDSFWDRDGYCGHEVVGTVIASKSERFRPGDTALALPTSYFKSTRREAAGYG